MKPIIRKDGHDKPPSDPRPEGQAGATAPHRRPAPGKGRRFGDPPPGPVSPPTAGSSAARPEVPVDLHAIAESTMHTYADIKATHDYLKRAIEASIHLAASNNYTLGHAAHVIASAISADIEAGAVLTDSQSESPIGPSSQIQPRPDAGLGPVESVVLKPGFYSLATPEQMASLDYITCPRCASKLVNEGEQRRECSNDECTFGIWMNKTVVKARQQPRNMSDTPTPKHPHPFQWRHDEEAGGCGSPVRLVEGSDVLECADPRCTWKREGISESGPLPKRTGAYLFCPRCSRLLFNVEENRRECSNPTCDFWVNMAEIERIDDAAEARRQATEYTLIMDRRTTELVQACVESHSAKATHIEGEDRERLNAVIRSLDDRLTDQQVDEG